VFFLVHESCVAHSQGHGTAQVIVHYEKFPWLSLQLLALPHFSSEREKFIYDQNIN
jgi:hypothetical protein